MAVFSLVFFGMTYWLSISPGKLVDRIGKILTPVLLLSIAILVGYAAINPMGVPQAAQGDFATHPLVKGILEGYGTMDALASLVFAIIVIDAVRAMGVDNRADLLKTTTISGVLAASCWQWFTCYRLYGCDRCGRYRLARKIGRVGFV